MVEAAFASQVFCILQDMGRATKKRPAAACPSPLKKGRTEEGSQEPLKKESEGDDTDEKEPLAKGLQKESLETLGQLSLKEKIQKIAETEETEARAGMTLKNTMSAAEKSKTWSRHQTYLNQPGNEEERAAFNALGKKEKGLASALWLMKSGAPNFCTVQKETRASEELTKTEKWYSEKQAIEKWGEDLWKHCDSGRIRWRECNMTHGVYEYSDTMDFTKTFKGTKASSWTQGQEYNLEDDDTTDDWEKLFNKDMHSLMLEGTLAKGNPLAKGSGKQTGKGGKGKPPGKSHKDEETKQSKNRGLLALMDMAEEEQLLEGVKKMKKLKDMMNNLSASLQDKMDTVADMDYFTKTAWNEKRELQQTMTKALQRIKKVHSQGEAASLPEIKVCLQEGVALMKTVRDELKELEAICQKTFSKK